jgi:hypothetical protein
MVTRPPNVLVAPGHNVFSETEKEVSLTDHSFAYLLGGAQVNDHVDASWLQPDDSLAIWLESEGSFVEGVLPDCFLLTGRAFAIKADGTFAAVPSRLYTVQLDDGMAGSSGRIGWGWEWRGIRQSFARPKFSEGLAELSFLAPSSGLRVWAQRLNSGGALVAERTCELTEPMMRLGVP